MIGLVAALIIPAAPVLGAELYVSGHQADVLCAESQDWCVGFVTGALDGWAALEAYYPGAKFCAPEGTTTGQIKELLVQELRSRPEAAEMPAAYVVYERLIREFPCP